MIQQFMKELEHEPFDNEEFVERLAWRTVDDFKDGIECFEPHIIYETFLQAIKDLQILQERQQKKCEKLEEICQEGENTHWQEIALFQEKNKLTASLFQDLDERINFVAAKVIHLGDHLENINIPRSRSVEAQKLMTYFSEFLSPGPVLTDIFTNKEEVFEAAEIIQKLHMIAQELPAAKFEDARKKISTKYDEIERTLIEEFVKAHRLNDVAKMKEIASILSQFKSYSQCIDAFIEESQQVTFGVKDIFKEVLPLTKRNFTLMREVFSSPEQVMAKFVLNLYYLKLQKHIVSSLSCKSDTNKYLENLMDLYTRTVQLSNELSCFKMGTDDTYLSKLTHTIFQKYLDSYISTEVQCLKEKCAELLQMFYDSKDHQKKQLQTGGFQDLRRDIKAAIRTRANISIAPTEDYGGETFLSEELVINILHEAKVAFKRCVALSRPTELSNNAIQLLEVIVNAILVEHIDYAVELAMQIIPIPETKTQMQKVYFFDVVKQSNFIVHLLEKHYSEYVLPLVISTPKHGEYLLKKKFQLNQLEIKLDNGIDRAINAIVGWVKIYLQFEQKKTDFKPDTDLDTLSSNACLTVVQYMSDNIKHIRESLDGTNRELVMTELGCRFHRVIYEHLQQFQYNSTGAMCVICDVNEYRKCAKELSSPLVNTLFDTLHALCNLLLVKPENLNQVCNGDHLGVLEDKSILYNFIQLRSDYKNQKIAGFLKGMTNC
uniref:Exocyst complex component 5 n=1 Tax=Panstrongylus megistus TaxID=65343 RepID=A0A069DWN9_9HEMI